MFYFLMIVTAYLLILAMIAIGVVGAHPGAIRPMLRAPRQFFRLLVSKRMRQNHALEHATINVLRQRHRISGITGMPAENGFHLRGRVAPETVIGATQEAIRRLKRGERQLAWSRACPTSLVASQLLLAIVLLAAMFGIWRDFTVPPVLIALLGAALLGPLLSPYLQRILLVDPKPGQLQFRDVEPERPSGRLALMSFLVYSPLFVRTASVSKDGRTTDGDVTLITSDQEEIAAGGYRWRE